MDMDARGSTDTRGTPKDPAPPTLYEAYQAARQSATALLTGLTDADTALPVPACPGWRVRDLTAHLLQVCRDGRGEEPATGPLPYEPALAVPRLLELWERDAAELEQRIPLLDQIHGPTLVLDALTHEQDLRYALGLPQVERHPALRPSFGLLLAGFGRSLAARALPSVRFEAPGTEGGWVVGEEPSAVTVRAPRHAIYRMLAGRRSSLQIAAMDWSRPAEPWLPAFTWGPFRVPPHAVED